MNYWLKYTRPRMALKCYPYWPDFKRHYVLKASASLLIFFVFSHLFFFREFPQIFPKAGHQMIHHVHILSFIVPVINHANPNHRLHTTDLAATQGAFRQVRPDSDAMRLPNRSGAPPEAGEVAWNTYLKRRVSNHDTHRGDALKASAVLPTMWYRKWELLPAAEQVVRPYIREVVSNRV